MAEKVEQRSRSWCFTLNNYTVDDITHITHTFEQYVFQEETGETGHLIYKVLYGQKTQKHLKS